MSTQNSLSSEYPSNYEGKPLSTPKDGHIRKTNGPKWWRGAGQPELWCVKQQRHDDKLWQHTVKILQPTNNRIPRYAPKRKAITYSHIKTSAQWFIAAYLQQLGSESSPGAP